MRTNIIVVDDFYNNPHEVRTFALAQPFDVKGNYPGFRTGSFINDGVKNTINNILFGIAGQVTNWMEDSYGGAFQLCTSADRTWIHTDQYNTWAGVLYLTPDAPLSGGTALYKHKLSGERGLNEGSAFPKDAYDYTQWDIVDRIGNVFNRLVLFRGDLYHASVDYFGSDMETGRLFQTFFFNTEH
jgi:hypothetical protein